MRCRRTLCAYIKVKVCGSMSRWPAYLETGSAWPADLETETSRNKNGSKIFQYANWDPFYIQEVGNGGKIRALLVQSCKLNVAYIHWLASTKVTSRPCLLSSVGPFWNTKQVKPSKEPPNNNQPPTEAAISIRLALLWVVLLSHITDYRQRLWDMDRLGFADFQGSPTHRGIEMTNRT